MSWLALSILWLLCIAPSIHWLDTTSLVLTSSHLGISHPPGHIPYAMLASIMQWIPVGDVAFRMSLFSLLMSLVGGWAICKSLSVKDRSDGWIPSALFLSVGSSGLVMTQAIRPEVYGLALALTGLSILAASKANDRRYLYIAWFLWACSAATHPIISLAAIPFLLTHYKKIRGPMFCSVVGLMFVYLPIRSSTTLHWNFGNPGTWKKFLWYVRGELYKAYDGSRTFNTFDQVTDVFVLFFEHLTVPIVLLSLVGIAWLVLKGEKRERAPLFALILGILPLAAMTNFWAANPDVGGYLLPTVWILASITVYALTWVSQKNRTCTRIFGILILATVPFQLWKAWTHHSMRGDWSAHRHMVELTQEPDRSGVIHTASFSTFSFLRYAQAIEGRRPDLIVGYRGLSVEDQGGYGLEGQETLNSSGHQWWELAIARDRKDHYRLRPEGEGHQMMPTGWFYKLGEEGNRNWLKQLRLRTEKIRNDMNVLRPYENEAMYLNYVLHILKSRKMSRLDDVKTLKKDFEVLFSQVSPI